MDLDLIAAIGREAFFKALCASPPDDSDSNRQSRWRSVAQIVAGHHMGEVEITFESLARKAHAEYVGSDWEQVPFAIKAAWEAAVRQMSNACSAETSEDWREMSSYNWKTWMQKKLQEIPQ